ncbi:M28 family metallopeptidase [Nannocystaceae bacterium ST9]
MSRFVGFPIVLSLVLGCERSDSAQTRDTPAPSAPEPATPAEPEPATAEPEPIDPTIAALVDRVDAKRYAADLEFVSAERPPGSPHWQAVQDRCAAGFAEAGFTVERHVSALGGTNVIGTRVGSAPELPAIVVGAHYDHIPGCAGADDNGSGVAAVLELARVLGKSEPAWTRTLMIACWDQEELGLLGSRAWADDAFAKGAKIDLYVNFDAMGYADHTPKSQRLPEGIDLLFKKQLAALAANDYRADFIAVLADERASAIAERFVVHAGRIELPATMLAIPDAIKNEPALADLRRSDHASFWAHDVPAVFLSDTAEFRTDTYHCQGRPDTADTVDVEFASKVVRASAGALAELLRR